VKAQWLNSGVASFPEASSVFSLKGRDFSAQGNALGFQGFLIPA
jgi:hypothetical protein